MKIKLCGILILLSIKSMALATPLIHENETFYIVQGRTLEDVRKDIDRARPNFNGVAYDASTRSNISWNLSYQANANFCQISSSHIDIDLITQFPRWSQYNTASPLLQKQWSEGLKAIRLHEEGHKNNGKIAALEIENTLNELPAMKNCEELKRVAEHKIEEIISEYRLKDIAYDQRTNHGVTQRNIFS